MTTAREIQIVKNLERVLRENGHDFPDFPPGTVKKVINTLFLEGRIDKELFDELRGMVSKKSNAVPAATGGYEYRKLPPDVPVRRIFVK